MVGSCLRELCLLCRCFARWSSVFQTANWLKMCTRGCETLKRLDHMTEWRPRVCSKSAIIAMCWTAGRFDTAQSSQGRYFWKTFAKHIAISSLASMADRAITNFMRNLVTSWRTELGLLSQNQLWLDHLLLGLGCVTTQQKSFRIRWFASRRGSFKLAFGSWTWFLSVSWCCF